MTLKACEARRQGPRDRILPVAEDLVEGPAGEGLPTVWTTGSRGASSGSPAPRLCDAELQMPELREKVAALREGGEMPEHWAEQLRDFQDIPQKPTAHEAKFLI